MQPTNWDGYSSINLQKEENRRRYKVRKYLSLSLSEKAKQKADQLPCAPYGQKSSPSAKTVAVTVAEVRVVDVEIEISPMDMGMATSSMYGTRMNGDE